MASPMLIVEDDDHCAQILCAMMRLRGWKPDVADCLAAAFESIAKIKPEVTLLDLGLPDSPAIRTFDEVLRLKASGAGRVVIVTGSEVSEQLRALADSSGADGILSKNDLRDEWLVDQVIGVPANKF